MVLDRNIHRFVELGKNMTRTENYSIVPATVDGENFLEVNTPNLKGITVRCKLHTPPSIGVKIGYDPTVPDQYLCAVNPVTTRILEVGTELSFDRELSITIVNVINRKGEFWDYIILNDTKGGLQQLDTGFVKIPPDTGTEIFLPIFPI